MLLRTPQRILAAGVSSNQTDKKRHKINQTKYYDSTYILLFRTFTFDNARNGRNTVS